MITPARRRPTGLPIMPASQQAGLHSYMKQIVGYRKSGLSLNHIIGCRLDCGYCVRHFWGNFELKAPQMLCTDGQAVELLTGHPAFLPGITPIQLFNKATDPFLPEVHPHLFNVLHALDQRGYTNHVLVITRFKVTAGDMAELEGLRHLRVTLLFTYSGISDARVEPIAKSSITVTSIRTACAAKNRTGVVLYWRPIVPGWNDQPETMAHVLQIGRDADAIVFTGYYHKAENDAYLRGLGVELPYGPGEHHRRKTMPADLDAKVVAAWRASGISTPLMRKTSCGVAYAHGTADYNGHWGIPELCDICPLGQRDRCAAAYQKPTAADMEKVLARLSYEPGLPYEIEDGHIWTGGLDEQRRYPIQHMLGYQVWDVRQPHHAHAHGRSPYGHLIDPAEQAHFAEVRGQMMEEARYEDD